MSIARRWKSRLLRTVCVLAAAAPLVQPTTAASDNLSVPASPAAIPTPESVAGHYLPEVRIRKLHLVRPDLIPYPIAYEIVC